MLMLLEDDFSDIVKKARQGRGLSVEDLAHVSGVSHEAIVRLEGGHRPPLSEELTAVARALELRARPLADIALHAWGPRPVSHIDGIETIHGDIGGYAVKGYVLFDSDSHEAVVIDTGYNPKSMVDVLERRGLALKAVCLTHGHVDHAGGLDRLLRRWPVPVYIGRGDIGLLGWRPAENLSALDPSDDGTTVRVGAFELRCMVTPGHTPGGLCYRARLESGDVCFVGDTLFAGSIGRANPSTLYPMHLQSVRHRLLELPAETRLFPGHGPATTVKEEREHNPFACATEPEACQTDGA